MFEIPYETPNPFPLLTAHLQTATAAATATVASLAVGNIFALLLIWKTTGARTCFFGPCWPAGQLAS